MGTIVNIVTFTTGASALLLFVSLCRRAKAERDFAARAAFLIFFILLNTVVLAGSFIEVALAAAPFLMLATLGATAWIARPLWTEPMSRRWMLIIAGAALCGFVFLQCTHGLFHFVDAADSHTIIAPTLAGKFFLAAVICGCVFLLGKFELLAQALSWRYGKRGTQLFLLLFALTFAVIMTGSVSLIYGRLSPLWIMGCQLISAGFFVALLLASRKVAAAPGQLEFSKPRLTHYLSTGAFIYAGAYLLGFGLLVKIMLTLGGDWEQFVSFLAALGAVVLALVLFSAESLRQRWMRFVERSLLAGAYDFRRELQKLTEAIAVTSERDQLIEAVCRTLADIFRARQCHLFVEENGEQTFRLFSLDVKGKFTIAAEASTLNPRQIAWLERMQRSFAAENFLEMGEAANAGDDKNGNVIAGQFFLGTTLFAGQRLLGGVLLGAKRLGAPYTEEEKQLLEVLTNAISIALHGTYLQQHLLATQQMESVYRVAAFMAHDLRNAVSTLNLLTQNATAHLEKRDFRADFIAALMRVAVEMQKLMQKFAAVRAGGETQRFGECLPEELLYDALADLPMPANVQLKEEIPDLPKAYWDRAQIRIVLRNLLLNALEAMPNGGVITIRSRHERGKIHFLISDTGVGMSPEFMRRRLFKPNQTTKAKGLGLGLYQSREIVAAHQGKIFVKSQPETGTTFEIILPCRPHAMQQSPGTLNVALTNNPNVDWLYSPASRVKIVI